MKFHSEMRELAGKTIERAGTVERQNGDLEFVMHFADGSSATVAAWKREGHALQMAVDLSPNDRPQADSGASSRREM